MSDNTTGTNDFSTSRQNEYTTQAGSQPGQIGGDFDNNAESTGNQFDGSDNFSQGGNDTSRFGNTGGDNYSTQATYGSSDANTENFGTTGSNMGSTGIGGRDADDFQYDQSIDNTGGNTTQNKASMGNRVKGTAQEMYGKVTNNPEREMRGQERKTGEPVGGNIYE